MAGPQVVDTVVLENRYRYYNNSETCGASSVIMFEAYSTDFCFPESGGSVNYQCTVAEDYFTVNEYLDSPTCNGASVSGEYPTHCIDAHTGATVSPLFPSYESYFNFTYFNTSSSARQYACEVQPLTPTPFPSSISTFPTVEYSALQDLYTSAGGEAWTWMTPYTEYGVPWNFTHQHDPCKESWQGLLCSEEYIVSIALMNYNLVGTIPPTISNFSLLVSLVLQENHLTGTIPYSMGLISKLSVLQLNKNRLTGSIPESFSQLGNLNFLYLGMNPITGTLPDLSNLLYLGEISLTLSNITGPMEDYWCSLPTLRQIDFLQAQLTGTIPDCLGNLPQINNIELSENQFTGTIPSTLSNANQLAELDLSKNRLTGTIHASLFSLPALTDIYLQFNLLNGTLPAEVGDCTSLHALSLATNRLTGTLPSTLAKLTNLKGLYLYSNEFTGTLPEMFAGMTELIYFEMTVTRVLGSFPESLCECSKLQRLYLYQNRMNGTIPACISSMQALEEFQIYSNYFSGSLPASMSQLTALSGVAINDNYFTGRLPDLSASAGITSIYAENNFFTGPIPSFIGDSLTRITALNLGFNLFNGTVPINLKNLHVMYQLGLGNNQLTGKFPQDIWAGLPDLIYVVFEYNYLTGTLPLELGQLLFIMDIYANNNLLTGPIPNTFGGTNHLVYLTLESNFHTGTIPEAMLSLSYLRGLVLSDNLLNGTIPHLVNPNNTEWESIELFNNALTGSVPDTFSFMRTLQNLDINNNLLTGTISDTIFGNLTDMVGYDLSYNFFSGTISHHIGDALGMHDILVNNNLMTGTVPASITNLFNMSELLLEHNSFSGTIPEDIGNFHNLSYFGLHYNDLVGSLPDSIGSLVTATNFDVSNNALTGTIPAGLSSMTKLTSLDLSNNRLIGTVPTLRYMADLELLLIGNNQLSGSLNNVFNASNQQFLATIDVSYNQLTGQLPSELFNIRLLQNFAAVSNCFSGSLPSVCNASNLVVLALDGIVTASSCQSLFFGGTGINTYQSVNTIAGGVPSCYYALPSLTTLHLSGNGITGSLPDDVMISPKLADLSVANNQMTGTIPAAFQAVPWVSFDLSYNRFTGILSSSIDVLSNNATFIGLQVNRLSGQIPGALVDVQDISVLDGNLFQCDYQKSSLPTHDGNYKQYDCGSNAFNWSIYLWVALVAVSLSMFLTSFLFSRTERLSRFASSFIGIRDSLLFCSKLELPNIKLLTQFNAFIRSYGVAAIVLGAAVLIVIYGILTAFFHSYDYEYAWTISAAYLTGLTPGIILCFVFSAVLLATLAASYVLQKVAHVDDHTQSLLLAGYLSEEGAGTMHGKKDAKRSRIPSAKVIVKYLPVFLFNFAVTVVVNASYVYIAVTYGTTIVTISQLAIAVYKLMWNRFVIPKLLVVFSPDHDFVSDSNMLMFQFTMEIFNNIIAPCLATAAISRDCFYNTIYAPPQVDSGYSIKVCTDIKVATGNCTAFSYVTTDTSYTPPYVYSYQCSSILVSNYAAVFVYMFLLVTVGKPIIFGTIGWIASLFGKSKNSFAERVTLASLPSIYRGPTISDASSIDGNMFIFDKVTYLLSMYTHAAILFTFGVVFPPLAYVIAFSYFCDTFYAEMNIGRYLLQAQSMNLEDVYANVINNNLSHLYATWPFALTAVINFSAFFYALFVFDVIGDSQGWGPALAALILITLVPYMARFAVATYIHYCGRRGAAGEDEKVDLTFHDSITENPIAPRNSMLSSTRSSLNNPLIDGRSSAAATPLAGKSQRNDDVNM